MVLRAGKSWAEVELHQAGNPNHDEVQGMIGSNFSVGSLKLGISGQFWAQVQVR